MTVEKIYDDFAGLGQAVRVAKETPGTTPTYFHIFRRHKDYDRVVRGDTFAVSFIDADQLYATGLSVGKVPGISIIFSGFLLCTFGLFISVSSPRQFATMLALIAADGHFKGNACGIWISDAKHCERTISPEDCADQQRASSCIALRFIIFALPAIS